jgi:VanZ family protein
MSKAYAIKAQASWILSPRVHVFMYALLLIATPFILLRNFLVQAIALLSDSSFSAFGVEIKIIPAAVLLASIALLIIYRRHITKLRLSAVAIVILLDTLAQQVTDYYFDHNFYDLQQNWHYFAYGLYAYMIYRDLHPRGLPLYKIMLITYFSALGLSTFDEIFQKYMSSRIFDVCDIGKDVWGVYAGMILIYFSSKHSQLLFKDWKQIRHEKMRNYYRHPFTLLILMFVLSILFLSTGSVLTEAEYTFLVVILTIVAFSLFFAVLHLSRFKAGKIIIVGILVGASLLQSFFFMKYREKNIVYTRYGLTIYKGFPIPFFDIMIFQNGIFRLVDKKHSFNQRDIRFFLKRKPDIILIGSGAYGQGGKGFGDPRHVFLYNLWAKRATQVIIQKNSEAGKTFNRLKKENKNVLFIIHNTC